MSTETDNIRRMSRDTAVRIVSNPLLFHNSNRNGSLATNTWLLNGYCNVLLELAADLFSCGMPRTYYLVRHVREHFDQLNDHLSDRREMRSNAHPNHRPLPSAAEPQWPLLPERRTCRYHGIRLIFPSPGGEAVWYQDARSEVAEGKIKHPSFTLETKVMSSEVSMKISPTSSLSWIPFFNGMTAYHFPAPISGRRCGEPVEPDARVGACASSKTTPPFTLQTKVIGIEVSIKISPTPFLSRIPFWVREPNHKQPGPIIVRHLKGMTVEHSA
jgi:hypothetical protein